MRSIITMNGRESKQSNDLFFVCSLIGYIARKTKNKPVVIVDCLGSATIEKIYSLANVYHSDNIDRVSDDLIEDYNSSFYYDSPLIILETYENGGYPVEAEFNPHTS